MAFQHTHHPQFASKTFTNSSVRGKFGDALNELDWAVGQIFQFIEDAGVKDNTFVFFTSDNGWAVVIRREKPISQSVYLRLLYYNVIITCHDNYVTYMYV